MGTLFTVYLESADEIQAQACFQAVFDEIDRLESTFSRFLASSEISRLNREAALGPVVTDPEVFQVLALAQDLSENTEGAFDITVGRLTRAWGFPERQPHIPDADTLAAAAAAVGWHKLRLDPEWRTVEFLVPGLELDLGGIAKGYAVDCALQVLSAASVDGAIDAGSSSIAATGGHLSLPWRVQIPHPRDSTQILCEVPLGDHSLATSGVREQSFSLDGQLYSHLIDPEPGRVRDATHGPILQCTVLAPSSLLADGLSTALFLLGPERGRAVMEAFADCSVLWVYEDGDGIACSGGHWPEQAVPEGYEGMEWNDENS
jgi:thiamine biosynthesis lipoprotein